MLVIAKFYQSTKGFRGFWNLSDEPHKPILHFSRWKCLWVHHDLWKFFQFRRTNIYAIFMFVFCDLILLLDTLEHNPQSHAIQPSTCCYVKPQLASKCQLKCTMSMYSGNKGIFILPYLGKEFYMFWFSWLYTVGINGNSRPVW